MDDDLINRQDLIDSFCKIVEKALENAEITQEEVDYSQPRLINWILSMPAAKPVIEINGRRFVAQDPKLKTIHKDGEVVLGGFKEVTG